MKYCSKRITNKVTNIYINNRNLSLRNLNNIKSSFKIKNIKAFCSSNLNLNNSNNNNNQNTTDYDKIFKLKNLYIGQIEHLEGSNLIKIPTSTKAKYTLYSLNNSNEDSNNSYHESTISNNNKFKTVNIYCRDNQTLDYLSKELEENIKKDNLVFKFLNEVNYKELDKTKEIKEILSDNFILNIKNTTNNNELNIYHLADIRKLSKVQNKTILNDFNSSNINTLNLILASLNIKSIKNNNDYKYILNKIEMLIHKYQYMLEYLNKKEIAVEKQAKRNQNFYIYIIILYSLIHLIAFYYLIYKYYGWDEIEPITFLVGNLYWIIGIAFFIMFKSKLGIEFLFQKEIINKIRSKTAFKLGFCKFNQNNLSNHINKLDKFKNCLSNKI